MEGLLPAHAGVILCLRCFRCWETSAPRACGGDPAMLRVISTAVNCSPRMRG